MVEWIKTQFALAKSGDARARRKLLVTLVTFAVLVSLLVSGQSASKPVEVEVKQKQNTGINLATGYVHISGAVVHPGVYAIDAGMRLFEVVSLAGGFSKTADQSSVNLARVVVDGEQIVVSGEQANKQIDSKVSLNNASAKDFDSLPGIGPTLSERIVQWRETNGSFQSVDELRKVGGIGDKLFASLKPLVKL